MANRIKGISVEISGDTAKLTKALKNVDSSIKNTQNQLWDVNKLLKLDPGNTELLSQKHKLLAQAVGDTKQRLETLKTAAEQANDALAKGEISQSQYDALQREIVETEQELRRLETAANQSATAVQKIAATGEKLKTLGNNISNVGQKFLPATVAPYTEVPESIGLVDTFTPIRFGRLTALRFIAEPQVNPVIVTEIIEPADRNEMTFNREYVWSETTFEFQTDYSFTNFEVPIDEGRMSRIEINTEQFARIDSLEVKRSGDI